jgi:hypothetical protein
MRRAARIALTGLATAAAALTWAAPALADVAPQPVIAGALVLALVIVGVIVVGVAVVAVFVLRGIARSRRLKQPANEYAAGPDAADGGRAEPRGPADAGPGAGGPPDDEVDG